MNQLVRLGPEAAESLAEVHASAFPRPWSAGDLVDMMAGLGAAALGVEEDEGALAGFVLIQAVAGEAEILTLAVSPRARRAGVGRALVEAAAAQAVAGGATALWLEVAQDNAPALALYRASGFAPAGLRRGYYRSGNEAVDAVVMRRPLNRGANSPYSP